MASNELELTPTQKRTFMIVGGVASAVGAAVGTYHGYGRNKSIGWALGWGFLGSLFPVVVVPIALAQGIGEPKGRR